MPHRLGLSESVLFFEQHIEIFGGWDSFAASFEEIKLKTREKRVIVEVSTLANAILASSIGADIIQIDKQKPDDASKIIKEIRIINKNQLISVAGGINVQNVKDYAKCGADILVTSALYHAKPLDITTKITSWNRI